MIRDNLKDQNYFLAYIEEEEQRIHKFETKLRDNEVREDRIFNVKRKVFDLKLQVFIARYSMGEEVESLVDAYKELVVDMEECWSHDQYEDMLWMLSIGVMLEVDRDCFAVLEKLVQQSGVDDVLYHFLLRSPNAHNRTGSWEFDVPFKSLEAVIGCNDKGEAVTQLKHYLEKKWYIGHQDMGWYECHKHAEKLYFGYWSFESGAIAKILELNDASLAGVSYYPYDMVHFKK